MSIEKSVLEKLLKLPVEKQRKYWTLRGLMLGDRRGLKSAKRKLRLQSGTCAHTPRSQWCCGASVETGPQ